MRRAQERERDRDLEHAQYLRDVQKREEENMRREKERLAKEAKVGPSGKGAWARGE